MQIPIGAIIVCCFALIWAGASASQLGRSRVWVVLAAALLTSTAVVFAAATIRPAHRMVFNAGAYNWSVAFEAVFMIAAVTFLKTTGRKIFIFPVISFIVGLHFFGMVWALGSTEYWWIGGAMCLLPVLTLLMLPQRAWMTVVGFGCAIILWASVIWSLFY
jgi:hypothetical protein